MRRAVWSVLVGSCVVALAAACAPPSGDPPNSTPTAVATFTPETGTAPLEVEFASGGSFDPDGEIVSYTWEFGDGTERAHGPVVTHTYVYPGTYTATLSVTDDSGAEAWMDIQIPVLPEPPPPPLPAPTLAADEPISLEGSGQPIAVSHGDPWDIWGIREPGAVIHDPVTGLWICTYTGRGNLVEGNAAVTASIGAVISNDGETWQPHPQNPLTGAAALGGIGQAEDPYIAKDATTGEVWRDSAGRALMFTEEKDFDVHRGVAMWRSGPNTLSDWTLFGQVVDRGPAGAWDATDRTSPVVIHDGTQLVMLFEGRNMPEGQEGLTGIAFSEDEGETWTLSPDPIMETGEPGSWNDNSVVPDDLIRVGGEWIFLAHGQELGAAWTAGRFSTTDDPADWTIGSFTELPGNPMSHTSNTVMAWGNDPHQVIQFTGDGRSLERGIVTRPNG